uniref:Uncharacterized protein n=1 Tax=Rhizophora mucronata TaxID=61149 RepID=A0A2P2P9M2_RHIMU
MLFRRRPSSQMLRTREEKRKLSTCRFWRQEQDGHEDPQCHPGCNLCLPFKVHFWLWRLYTEAREQ